MGRLLALINANPAVLLWVALAAFVAGISSGGMVAWKVQGWRLDAVTAKYDTFVAQTKAAGDAAQARADAHAAEDKRNKENVDHEYQIRIAALTADNRRLHDARTRTDYLPAAPASSPNPDIACFDRAELERALRRFDEGITGLVGEGDAAEVGLNAARSWAAGSRGDKFRDNPATHEP